MMLSTNGTAKSGSMKVRYMPTKTPYLNSMFFVGRNIFYFVVWIGLAWFLLSRSLKQDESGDEKITSRVQAICAPAMILFVLALVFAAFDWEMSLAPMWFSTMFPVYFFAGAVLSALATITLTCLLLQRSGRITDEVTIENYHDLAKLTFGFIVFWGYIAFSQFMLIWYANIPEETFWYQLRFSKSFLALCFDIPAGGTFVHSVSRADGANGSPPQGLFVLRGHFPAGHALG